MRECFFLSKRKRKVESIEIADSIVRQKYPNCQRYGSLAAWHWEIRDPQQPKGEDLEEIVAEAWVVHGRSNKWWLTIKGD